MRKIALVFPGQGAQKVGMGREFFETVPVARAVFEKADSLFGSSLSNVIFNGPEEKLMSTAFCQPAIFTMSMAAMAALRASDALMGCSILFTAGLSLGEYGALCAAGVLSFEESLDLIQKRAQLMEIAAKQNPGKMAAVIGFDVNRLEQICCDAGCEIANYNAPDQIVITGLVAAVDKACALILAAGGKKVIPLDVAGAFHSSLMKSAADLFVADLKTVKFHVSDVKVVSNVTACPQISDDVIRENLAKQIYSSVQWVKTINFFVSSGITDLVEIGPGRILKGLVRKIAPELHVHSIQSPQDIAALTF